MLFIVCMCFAHCDGIVGLEGQRYLTAASITIVIVHSAIPSTC